MYTFWNALVAVNVLEGVHEEVPKSSTPVWWPPQSSNSITKHPTLKLMDNKVPIDFCVEPSRACLLHYCSENEEMDAASQGLPLGVSTTRRYQGAVQTPLC